MAVARVIVIGGGLAGLGAAKTLCDSEKFEVTLLEADKVIGGRVKCDNLEDGTLIPMGAASFHGRKGNPLYTYAESEGLIGSQEFRIQDDLVLHTYSEGRKIPDKVVKIVEDKVEEILDGLEDCFDNNDWSQFKRVEKVVHQSAGVKVPSVDLHDLIVAELEPIMQEEDILKSHDSSAILEGIIAYEGITEGCKGLRGIDAVSLGSWQYLDNDIDFVFRENPYLKVVNSLSSKLPSSVIKVDKEVCNVIWNGESSQAVVTVECTDGSTYQADHVIYTCSLGVLKHACSTGSFSPPLPPAKASAIDELAIGLVNKVFIQFNGPLVPDENYTQFRLYWTQEDMNDPVVIANKWVTGLQFMENYNYCKRHSNRFAYCIFLLGEDALMVESLPEEEVGRVIVHYLGLFLACPLPELLSVKVTRWSNEYTRGSYSYTPHGVPYDKRKHLGTPVSTDHHPLQILFAGEATSFTQFGCAHSAFDTGIREANRLIKHY